jgi:diguanylate cyclase (GGDEF)-like protein
VLYSTRTLEQSIEIARNGRAPGASAEPSAVGGASLLFCDHRGAGLHQALALLARSGYRVQVSSNLQRTLRVLQSEEPDAILLAPVTRSGALELDAIRGSAQQPDAGLGAPFLLVADPADPLPVLEAAQRLSGGVYDVIYRNAPPAEFALRLARLSAEHARLRESDDWRHRAWHDDRTDLLRPRIFEARLSEHFSAAQRHGLELALVLIDLDRFGAVNKEHDHTVGDRIIARVGELIRRGLRSEDCGGRLGGDEFAVLLPYTAPSEAQLVVRRLQESIAALAVLRETAAGSVRVSVTASLGFETFDGGDLRSAQELRQNAEQALREAKRAGGNTSVYHRGGEPEKPRRRPPRRRTKEPKEPAGDPDAEREPRADG